MRIAIHSIWHLQTWLLILIEIISGSGTLRAQEREYLTTFQVVVNITLSTAQPPENAEVKLMGLDPPFVTLIDTTPPDGIVIFEEVEQGYYQLRAFKVGFYAEVLENVSIETDTSFNILLQEKRYPPTGLFVDDTTLNASWAEPLRVALDEHFEGSLFPPEGWESVTEGEGWFPTIDGSLEHWVIPHWKSQYACSRDLKNIPNNGCCDYLITPPLDLRESDGYILAFDSFYDGTLGEIATVEYSIDSGSTWQILYSMIPFPVWRNFELDLSAFCGATGPPDIRIAFHADDAGSIASGWAIDNVKVFVPDPPANYIDFYIYLDDDLMGYTTNTSWNFAPLTYNEAYTASVAARYSSGLSGTDSYNFLCHYLIPPRNLAAAAVHDTVILLWDPPVEFTSNKISTIELPREEFPDPFSEYSRTYRAVTTGGSLRDAWDLQLSFPNVVTNGEAGAETDGEFFYTAMWNGTEFHQYDLDGNYIGAIAIDGVSNIRDMAFDPTTGNTYGSNTSNVVYEWNFSSGEYISNLIAPTTVRAIAYDEQFDGFWANNWSSAITLFDKNGVQLNSFPVGSFGHYYGLAYDKWSDGGPYLYGYSQDGSGNLIVQIEIATGQETGFVFDLNEVLPLGLGVAGGLFTHYNIFPGTVSIGGNSQNDTYFLLELMPYDAQSGTVPLNLTGYNIYRHDNVTMFHPHNGGFQNPIQQMAIDDGILPGHYQYKLSGVYDLSPYGYPGETGESVKRGPVNITVRYCHEIPFMEAWDSGYFESNEWVREDVNWIVNSQAGNPPPTAGFNGEPIKVDYISFLTSYPICATGMTEGQIWLDYNIQLSSVNNTGSEQLGVEIWNWTDRNWTRMVNYSNLEGSFDWTDVHMDITEHAMGEVFRVRFRASGINSLNILSWLVDNIGIYRVCEPPVNLTSELDLNQMAILLDWEAPAIPEGLRSVAKYDIYRSMNGEPYQLLDTTTVTSYTDADLLFGIHCYKVSAIWRSPSDECESPSSNETCELMVDIGGPDNGSLKFSIYPVPADDHVVITAAEELKRVTIYDAMGRLMADHMPAGDRHFKLNTSAYSPGVYMVRIMTASAVGARTLTIQR